MSRLKIPALIPTILLFSWILGCGDEGDVNNDDDVRDDTERVHLVSTNPVDGSAFPPDGVLSLTFDNPPQSVTVNGTQATFTENTATWIAPRGFLFSLDSAFQRDLDNGKLSKEIRRIFEEHGIPVSQSLTCSKDRQWRIYHEDNGSTYEVGKVNDTLNVYNRQGLPFGPVTLTIEWINADGSADRDNISLNVHSLDSEPPRITGGTVKHGDENVRIQLLYAEGITIEFSEPIQLGFIQMRIGNAPLSWAAKWGKDTVWFYVVAGPESAGFFDSYIIDIMVKDLAGNELAASIRFSTEPGFE
jgi:hypothetical protein